MISPYVRRRRLATELVALREERGWSGQDLADAIGVARQRISRVENGHVRPDLDEVMRILTVFGVEGDRWTHLVTIAREAQEHGWWEKYADEMGQRQALCANLEAGATQILEYQMTLLPGLLQIPAYTSARAVADRAAYPPAYDPRRALEARAARQQMLDRPGGPRYKVIIDELAVRRFAAEPSVVGDQLRHIVRVGRQHPTTSVQVLPMAASIAGHAIPRSAFFIYHYPDDSPVVMVDTITSDLVVTSQFEAVHYAQLYEDLSQAALGPDDSLAFLAALAEEIPSAPQNGVDT